MHGLSHRPRHLGWFHSRRSHGRATRLIAACAALALAAGTFAQGENRWTGGAGDGQWESGGNWSQGSAPDSRDDVVIPGNSGVITTNGDQKTVKSLNIQPSDGAPATRLTNRQGAGVRIRATDDVDIGAGSGAVGQTSAGDGDGVAIVAGGNVTNGGVVRGGNSGATGNAGGVTVAAGGQVSNTGTIEGGNAGGSGGGGAVQVTGGTGVNNGAGGIISGGTGNNNRNPRTTDHGDVEINSGGNVNNGGTIMGGPGSNTTGTTNGRNGGDVKVTGKGDVRNDGDINGGNGGNSERGRGGDAGGVDLESKDGGVRPGRGSSTPGTGPRGDGKRGHYGASGLRFIAFLPGDRLLGDTIVLTVADPAGVVFMANLPGQTLVADRFVSINAGSRTSPIDLRGNHSGEVIIMAREFVCLYGQPILDRGVTLGEIIVPEPELPPMPCPGQPPRCYPDCDKNGVVDIRDFFCFQSLFAAQDPYADCDGNGVLDIRDFFCFQSAYAQACE